MNPATEMNISSKLPGQLEEVLVKEGDFVEAGQVLAKIKVSTLEAQLRQLEAQKRQDKMQLLQQSASKYAKSVKSSSRSFVQQRQTQLTAARNRLARTEILGKKMAHLPNNNAMMNVQHNKRLRY